jgi:peptidoglycan/xylan/chitin deacetylase (PgdA/CDA1 family)
MLVLVVILLLLAASTALLWYQPRWLVHWVAGRHPDVLFRVETSQRAVALTIDDSPHATLTPRIIDILAHHGARATFFVLGENVPGNEAILDRLTTEGHELGVHMMRDRPSFLLAADEFERQLLATAALLSPYGSSRWFRPGSGWFHPRMLRQLDQHGYRCCLASLYVHDARVRRAHWIAGTILRRVQPGDIIVLHEGRANRDYATAVLEELLPGLQELGYEVMTVSELVALAGP